jgi:uncharacterized membrane protein YcaP (DUF421 family)
MHVSWEKLFTFSVSPLELVVRGTLIYLLLFAMFRVFKRRETGALSIADLLVVVLVGEASQNGMTAGYETVADAGLLVVTIFTWNFGMDWLGSRVPLVERLIRPAPVVLVREGKVQHRNMRREMITVEELMSQVREQGTDELAQVKLACMEPDGSISVVT